MKTWQMVGMAAALMAFGALIGLLIFPLVAMGRLVGYR